MRILLVAMLMLIASANLVEGIAIDRDSTASPVEFVSSFFENGSPLYWEYNPDGSVSIRLLYDHERAAPNRASNHWHFQVHAKAGSDVTLMLEFFHETYNGRKVKSYSLVKNYFISPDGVNWTTVQAEQIENVGHRLQIHMPADKIYIAGLEPYRISDLDKLLDEIRDNPLVEIRPIGKTVEGRQLEIIRIGNPDAPHQVFLRARAHPWEPGGNWVVQGLVRSLLEKDKKALPYLDNYCVYIMPMANKDGVARGLTRFNLMGKDLNRGWERPADQTLAPENFALETWLRQMEEQGKKPEVFIDLHNDRGGKLSFRRNPEAVNGEQYRSNTQRFESLMYKHTWYTWTERGVRKDASNAGNYSVSRYDVDIRGTLELNQNWIAGLGKIPFGEDWELMGRQLRDVFYFYFDDKK